MLQPALNTPALNRPALNPSSSVDSGLGASTPTTYGALMGSAREALEDAIVLCHGRPPTGEAALQELLGYERFLYAAGGHLRQLTTLAELHTDAVRRLVKRLDRSTPPEVQDSTWLRAATILSAAHDLVATHLLADTPRTIEAEELALGPASAAASREVISMILDAIDGSRQLMHRIGRAQQRGHGASPIPGTLFSHLHATNHVISLCARATMYDLAQLPASAGGQLDHLQPALPSDLNVVAAPIHNPLAALRVLRQLCHQQARGLTAASPASLRDLALLGARVTTTDVLPSDNDGSGRPDQPLYRLQRAHAEDQLDTARNAWLKASTELTTTVQGLTKAPGAYGAAIRTLLDQPLDQRTQAALLTALPAVGRDAARTVHTLARRGGLVTRQPIPLQPRTAWRPINDEHTAALTERFGTAALTSARALAAVRDLHGPGTGQASFRNDQVRQRQVFASLERGVSR